VRTVLAGLWLILLTGWLLLVQAGVAMAGETLREPMQTLREAVLVSVTGERRVTLPHVLEASDFAPEGSRVRYQLHLDLATAPTGPLGLYVGKMSLAGQLHLNGELIGPCAPGVLENLRCLHQPVLFMPPPSHWRAGANLIELEVFANNRQMNGLAPVTVGPLAMLERDLYLPHYLRQVELMHGLTWATVCLGLISLGMALVLRGEAVYLWFGLASIVNAVGNLNALVTTPPVEMEVFSWLVFSSRLISVPLMMLTLLSFFQQALPTLRRILGISLIAMPLAVGLSGNHRTLVSLLYVPFLLASPVLLWAMVRWTRRSRKAVDFWMTVTFTALASAGLADWLRLGGQAAFEGVYLVAYVFTGTMLVMGVTLAGLLAAGLHTARELTTSLDRRVAERTQELAEANRQLEALSITDGLTGLANRRRFDEVLEREWRRTRRLGLPLALLMIDVDHFKPFNDHYGHPAGDECLRQVAGVLQARTLRSTDLAARYGGEEFAVIAACDEAGAHQLARTLRQAIEALNLPHAASPLGRVTVSLGVAVCIPGNEQEARELLNQADAALYRAKTGGRNRIEVDAQAVI
jgi:diguanylate cyclase (GGDEF)-like protein